MKLKRIPGVAVIALTITALALVEAISRLTHIGSSVSLARYTKLHKLCQSKFANLSVKLTINVKGFFKKLKNRSAQISSINSGRERKMKIQNLRQTIQHEVCTLIFRHWLQRCDKERSCRGDWYDKI